MKQAILSFTSGKGKRVENIQHAIRCMECLSDTTVLVKSGLYEIPVSKTSPETSNVSVIAVVFTRFSPYALMGACKGIEAAIGRAPDDHSDIRAIDIDLILYEGYTCNDYELVLPGPDFLKREDILFPLGEIFPEGKALEYDFSGALKKLDGSRVKTI